MPNHVKNKLQFIGDKTEVEKVILHIQATTEEGEKVGMDFNKIVPMPESLDIESGSMGETAYELLFNGNTLNFERNQKVFANWEEPMQRQAIELAFKYKSNIEQHGHATWYGWAKDNWGTKWNAYGQGGDKNTEDTVYFQTAWSAPFELMQKLSAMFPLVKIVLTYADEDTGSNDGIITFLAGQTADILQPESGTKEAYDIYFELNPNEKENFILVDDNYKYIED